MTRFTLVFGLIVPPPAIFTGKPFGTICPCQLKRKFHTLVSLVTVSDMSPQVAPTVRVEVEG